MTLHQKNQLQPREATEVHSRLVKCPLAIEESRAYWERVVSIDHPPDAQVAFEEFWFGAKSLPWVKSLILNLQTRYDAFPEALQVLGNWHSMMPETRAIICHWHVQVTDPLYRKFAGDFLIARRDAARPSLHRDTVVAWVAENGRPNWTLPTRKQLAKRLLSVALTAGLISGRRDPRSLVYPRVGDEALTYVLHLLRSFKFSGTLLDNAYLRSVGLEGPALESRLRNLTSLKFQRNADVFEFNWKYSCLTTWAKTELPHVGLAS